MHTTFRGKITAVIALLAAAITLMTSCKKDDAPVIDSPDVTNVQTQDEQDTSPHGSEPPQGIGQDADDAPTQDATRLTQQIADHMPDLTLEITRAGEEDGELPLTVWDVSVTCEDEPDAISQSFQIPEGAGLGECNIVFVDIDFDGYLDIQVTYSSGSNVLLHFYRWDSAAGTHYGEFEEQPFFSLLASDYTVYPDTMQVLARIHNSIAMYHRELYQLTDGRYILLRGEYPDAELTADDPVYTVTVSDRDGDVFTVTQTQDEFFGDLDTRDSYLRFGAENHLTLEQAHALLVSTFGETASAGIEEPLEYEMSYRFENMTVYDGMSCYTFGMSWLVDNDHWSFLDYVSVAPDGKIIMSDGSIHAQ